MNNQHEESIDIKAIFNKILENWKYFVLSVILVTAIAFFYLRNTPSKYMIKSSILVKEDDKMGANDLLDGLDLLGGTANIDNEIGVLTSYSVLKNTIEKLPFEVSYYNSSKYVDQEIYLNSPFLVKLDTNHFQLSGAKFELTFLNKEQFKISIKAKEIYAYDLKQKEIVAKINQPINFSNTYKLGQQIEHKFFKFKIEPNFDAINKNPFETMHIEGDFSFTINNIDNLIRYYQENITAEPTDKKSTIINLTIKGVSVNKEIDFLNQLSKTFLSRELDQKNMIADQTMGFIDNQLFVITDSLQNIEETLKDFKANKKVLDIEITAKQEVEQLKELETERAHENMKLKYYKYLKQNIANNNNFNDVIAPSIIGIIDPGLTQTVTLLNELYSEKSEYDITTTKNNPYLNLLEKKIEAAKFSLAKNVDNIISSSEIMIDDLSKRITTFESTINELPETQRQLINIERKFNLNDDLYTFLLEKRAEAGIAKASNLPKNLLLDEARVVSNAPISPNKKMIMIMAVLIGLLIPFMFLIIRDYLRDTIESKKDLDLITEIPILGIIGRSSFGTNTVVFDEPKAQVSESFRSIRTNIQYLVKGSNQKVVVVTSSVSGEGKTFTAINIASAMAVSGKKTILIGLDLRKPKIFQDFGLNNHIGMSNLLIDDTIEISSAIQTTPYENLDLIAAGPIPPNPAELIELPKMGIILEFLKSQGYENIVLDTPPITLVTDALLLTEYANAIVYVVRQNFTKKDAIALIADMYKERKIANISIVVNDVNSSGNYGYGYGYSYAYGYGAEEKKPWYKKIF